MSTRLYDAHAHLPDHEYENHQPPDAAAMNSSDQRCSIINGTSPDDWSAVLEFTQGYSQALPAIGLHPHSVREAPEDWKETFLKLMDNHSVCAVGEIGLDRRDPDKEVIKAQLDAFRWQLEQAQGRNLPVSIHCVKATGLLMETLRSNQLPKRGIHLHAYAGPVELISELGELGAYFSFSARQLAYDNAKVRDRVRAVPTERLLIETDEAFTDDSSSLINCYTVVAEILGISFEKLAISTEENFKRYFLAGSSLKLRVQSASV